MSSPTRPRTIKRPRKEFAEQLAALPDNYLDCRSLIRHLWTAYDVDDHYRQWFVLYLECASCGCRKVMQVRRRDGQKHQLGSYDYPEDYQFRQLGRLFPVERDAITLELIDRVLHRKEEGTLPSSKRPEAPVLKVVRDVDAS